MQQIVGQRGAARNSRSAHVTNRWFIARHLSKPEPASLTVLLLRVYFPRKWVPMSQDDLLLYHLRQSHPICRPTCLTVADPVV